MQPGHFSDVAFLTLDNNEATQLTPTVQLHLSGACDVCTTSTSISITNVIPY